MTIRLQPKEITEQVSHFLENISRYDRELGCRKQNVYFCVYESPEQRVNQFILKQIRANLGAIHPRIKIKKFFCINDLQCHILQKTYKEATGTKGQFKIIESYSEIKVSMTTMNKLLSLYQYSGDDLKL